MIARHSNSQTYAVVRDTSKTLPKVESTEVQRGLGALPSAFDQATFGSPLALAQVRQEVMERLRSTGGRPSLADASRRVKIPVAEHHREDLEAIASEVATPEFSPSAGQIASVLIALSLRSLRENRSPHKQLAQ